MNYLPIGSVVTLQGGSQPIMIYGRKQIDENDGEWDYLACMYPEGNLGEKYNVFFDHKDIENVLFKGYDTVIDREMQKFLNN